MKTFCPLFFPKRLFAGRTGPCAASGRGPSRPSDTASVRGAAGSRCGVFRSGPLRPPPANARRGRGATGGERTGTAAAGRHCRCGSGGETAARSENLRTRRRTCRGMSRHADHSIASVQVAVFSSPSVVTNVTSIS